MTRRLVCLLLVLVLGGVAFADEDAGVRGRGWWGDLDKGEIVELADIVAKPRPFSGRQLTFFCILRGQDDVFVPQGTIFSRRKYTNVSAWPDGTALWEQEAYQKEEFPFLYIPTAHFARDRLVRLPRFTRLEITGRIRSIVRERPFVEITSWRETTHRLGQAVVDAVAWGDMYARGGKTELATAKYVEALRVDLPPVYDMKIRKRAADSMRRFGYPEEADRIERGEAALGGSEMPTPPEPRTTEPGALPVAPDAPVGFAPVEGGPGFTDPEPAPAGDTPLSSDLGSPPINSTNPFSRSNLPGQPYDTEPRPAPIDAEPGFSPPPTDTARPETPAPASNAANPFSRSNLPGVPVNPTRAETKALNTPRTTNLPASQPPATVPGATTFPAPSTFPAPTVPGATGTDRPRDVPAGTGADSRDKPRRPVLAPTRRPRLVGVR